MLPFSPKGQGKSLHVMVSFAVKHAPVVVSVMFLWEKQNSFERCSSRKCNWKSMLTFFENEKQAQEALRCARRKLRRVRQHRFLYQGYELINCCPALTRRRPREANAPCVFHILPMQQAEFRPLCGYRSSRNIS
uniref:Uncharacterized protein n=1 Tax=Toxoplasma gondii (strain ATCC 50861 / VEG) TaxID=432359 RepID=A0A0F7UXC5_TOXGV|nr:TPA: hypothetical protein BN1205_103420 [Toxoplasma gondii VEG]